MSTQFNGFLQEHIFMEKFGGNALIVEKLMSFKAQSIFVIGMDGGSTGVVNAKDCSRTGEP